MKSQEVKVAVDKKNPGKKNELRVGVFVCECGLNIAGSLDCEAVRKYAETLPDVAVSVLNKYTCADPGQNEIKRYIKENKLNRVVVASCSPLMHEPTFRACVASVGLNPYLMEMVNLREHCSWVHLHDRQGYGQAGSGPGQAAGTTDREERSGHQGSFGNRWRSGRYAGLAGYG
jgi:hypothetical protein